MFSFFWRIRKIFLSVKIVGNTKNHIDDPVVVIDSLLLRCYYYFIINMQLYFYIRNKKMKTLFRGAFRIITAGMVIMTVVLLFGYSDVETHAREYMETITDTPKYAASYTLSYNANGGSGAPLSQTGSSSYTVSSTIPVKFGYTFLGWTKSSMAASATYAPGDTITLTADTTLYAVWDANTYTVRYNANGGSGSMADSTFTYDESGALSLNTFTRDDCTFLGWAQHSDATVAVYSDGTVVENLTTVNNGIFELYAVWHMHSYITTVTENPTCTQTGMKAFVCSKCLDTYTEAIPATGHIWADATCTLPMICTVCDATQGSDLGHDYVCETIVEETCTTDGTAEFTCSRCTDSYTDAIPATGHVWADATCTVPETCSSCGETSGEALGHSYGSEITLEASCTTAGTETFECSGCHDSYTETIPATGHNWLSATCELPRRC